MQLRPSNELHRHRIQDAAMTGRRETVQWWDSHETRILCTDNMASFYLRKNTLLSYGKDRVVMNVEVSTGSPCYSKNHAKHTVMRNETSCFPALGMHSNHRALQV